MSTSFLQRMLRLKLALNVETDKEVAEALQMSPNAITERKHRDSFPVDRVHALARANPKVNAGWVLGGESVNHIEESDGFTPPTFDEMAA
jgi:hypothetical protein